jgi:hypothetical protein
MYHMVCGGYATDDDHVTCDRGDYNVFLTRSLSQTEIIRLTLWVEIEITALALLVRQRVT